MEKVPSLQVVRQSVPDEVEDIVMHALEKTPADRFQTMQEFVEALSESEADVTMQRTAARRAATASRRVPTVATVVAPVAEAPKSKVRGLVIGGGVLALLLIAGAVFAALKHRGATGVAGPSSLATGGLTPIASRFSTSSRRTTATRCCDRRRPDRRPHPGARPDSGAGRRFQGRRGGVSEQQCPGRQRSAGHCERGRS